MNADTKDHSPNKSTMLDPLPEQIDAGSAICSSG